MSRVIFGGCRASLRSIQPARAQLLCPSRLYSSKENSPKESSPKESSPKKSSPKKSSPKKSSPKKSSPKKSSPKKHSTKNHLDIESLLSNPTWSAWSLVPNESTPATQEITSKELHHLLRLSSLPQPTSPEEETKMLDTLHSQLHFVRDIQSVNTEGIEPLQGIRDETEGGIKEATIGLNELRPHFVKEKVVGRNGRPRRPKLDYNKPQTEETWDVLGNAKQKVKTPTGSFFVVNGP